MSIGNGLSFAQAAALAGINPSSLLGMGVGSTDSSITSGVNSLNTSTGYYQPTFSYTPAPTPSFNTINQVTGNGFGSSTNSFYTPSNSIFTNTGTNNFSSNLPTVTTPIPTPSKTGSPDGITVPGNSTTTSLTSTLPPVDKSALDVAADATSTSKVSLGTDPPA